MHALGKITAKGQTTVPREIREALKAKAGDTLLWELDEKGAARVRRVQPLDVAYLGALEGTLSEWNSDADEEAYRDL
jgi:bifunctional DNA-binding transcriptional regulator/antitoxin component of YhaV-PrlF toxin-antitoxin module